MLLQNNMVSVWFTKACPICWPSQGSCEVRPEVGGGGPFGTSVNAPFHNVPGESAQHAL